jgi:hypothetical protein
MIKGKSRAACFIDVPFASLKYVLTPENSDPQSPRYEPYGIAVTKRFAHEAGCRPVLYLSNDEVDALGIATSELWRSQSLNLSMVRKSAGRSPGGGTLYEWARSAQLPERNSGREGARSYGPLTLCWKTLQPPRSPAGTRIVQLEHGESEVEPTERG